MQLAATQHKLELFSDHGIRSVDLRCPKQARCRLRHNHWPFFQGCHNNFLTLTILWFYRRFIESVPAEGLTRKKYLLRRLSLAQWGQVAFNSMVYTCNLLYKLILSWIRPTWTWTCCGHLISPDPPLQILFYEIFKLGFTDLRPHFRAPGGGTCLKGTL